MKNIPIFKVHVDVEAALKGVRGVLESGFINEGEAVTELTHRMSDALDAKNLILVNSCTSALTLALRLSGVTNGTEVISTPMTCVASNTPVINLGAKLVWADIDARTGMIDPLDVEKRITPRTKAVLCVAWAGTPCDLDKLNEVCQRKGVKLIQDAAHAFGATYKGKGISHFADYTCFSFQAIKHITCGDGGALVCKSEKDYTLSKKLKWFGIDRDGSKDEKGNWKGQHWSVDIGPDSVGYKFNMNNLAAAIGLSQFPHIDKIIGGHRRNATVYDREFKDCRTIAPLVRAKDVGSSFWVYTVLLKDEKRNRDEVLAELNKSGIHAGLVHVPNDDYSCFADIKVDLPGVRHFSERQVSLPVGWWMTEADAKDIADRLKTICGE